MTKKVQKIYYARGAGEGHASFGDEKAQIYGTHLAKIIDKNSGIVSTQIIVDDAKKESSPIHDYFEWDDTKAAKQHRKYQARHLIQSIEIEVIESGESSQIVRAFHYVEEEDGERITKGFARLETIRKDTDKYNKFILEAYLRRMREMNNKYKKYKELEPITLAVDEILDKHTILMEVV